MGFDIFDLRQLSLKQIVSYTEQRQPVHPRQAELQFPSLPLVHLICSAQCALQLDSTFGVLFCYRDEKKYFSILVLCPQSCGLAIVLLDPRAVKMENEGGRAARGRSVNGIYIRTCGAYKNCVFGEKNCDCSQMCR